MRKKDTRPQFVSKIQARANKVKALNAIDTPEARKQRKAMNVHWHGKLVPTNVRGMYAGKKGMGAHPVRIKINAKNRPALAAMKKIMSGK